MEEGGRRKPDGSSKAASKRRRGSQSSSGCGHGMSEAQRARTRYLIDPLDWETLFAHEYLAVCTSANTSSTHSPA